MRGSTCSYPFTAPLSCMYGKLPADNKRTHKSEYRSQRVWSHTVKFVRLSTKKKTKKMQNLWKLSNYLLKPQGKREVLHSGKPSSLLSISARLSLLFCCTAAKIFFGEIACSEWIRATTFYWCCQKEGVWFAGAFFKEYAVKHSSWRTNPAILIVQPAYMIENIYIYFFGQCRKPFHCRYFVSRSKMASRIK